MRQTAPSPQDWLRWMEPNCPMLLFDYRNARSCNSATSPSIVRALAFHGSFGPAKQLTQMQRDLLTNTFRKRHRTDGPIDEYYTDADPILQVRFGAFSHLVRQAMMDRKFTARSYLLYHASKSEKLSTYAPGRNLGSTLSRSSFCVTPVKTSKVPPTPHSKPN